MNEANEFGFRVGDAVPDGFFDPPAMDEAMAMIADYARSSRVTPAALIDIFSMGIAARTIALGAGVEASHA